MNSVRVIVDTQVPIMLERVNAQMPSRIARASNEMQTSLNLILSGGRSGRMYGGHRASAPGEAPGNWHGTLRASFSPKPEWNGREGKACVVSGSSYVNYLEDGTSKMAARPFRDKVIEDALPKVEAILHEPF